MEAEVHRDAANDAAPALPPRRRAQRRRPSSRAASRRDVPAAARALPAPARREASSGSRRRRPRRPRSPRRRSRCSLDLARRRRSCRVEADDLVAELEQIPRMARARRAEPEDSDSHCASAARRAISKGDAQRAVAVDGPLAAPTQRLRASRRRRESTRGRGDDLRCVRRIDDADGAEPASRARPGSAGSRRAAARCTACRVAAASSIVCPPAVIARSAASRGSRSESGASIDLDLRTARRPLRAARARAATRASGQRRRERLRELARRARRSARCRS